jgi:hypothetical protein
MVNGLLAEFDCVSMTSTENGKVPVVVGMPEITPVPPFSDRPAGNEPLAIDHVYGVAPPLAASVAE